MCSYQHQHLLKVEGEREENVSDYVKKELKPSLIKLRLLDKTTQQKRFTYPIETPIPQMDPLLKE